MKKRFKIQDMHCSSCALTIDMDLEDLKGVNKSHTSYAASVTEVEFDENQLRVEEIIKTIEKSLRRFYLNQEKSSLFAAFGKSLTIACTISS